MKERFEEGAKYILSKVGADWIICTPEMAQNEAIFRISLEIKHNYLTIHQGGEIHKI